MKTITIKGTDNQLEKFRSSLSFNINEMPKQIEIRVYVVDSEEDAYCPKMNDELFMQLAEEGGRVYTLPTFQEAFNSGDVNTFTDIIRFIEITMANYDN